MNLRIKEGAGAPYLRDNVERVRDALIRDLPLRALPLMFPLDALCLCLRILPLVIHAHT